MATIVLEDQRTITATLYTRLSGTVTPVDLTDCTVQLWVGESTINATIVAAATGSVSVVLDPTSQGITEPGDYPVQWVVTYPDTSTRTFPEKAPEVWAFRGRV